MFVSRREFLWQWGMSATLPWLSPRRAAGLFRPTPADSSEDRSQPEPDYRFTPHYRTQSPLEGALPALQPGMDSFPLEKYAAEVESVLAGWSQALCQSPPDFGSLARSLASHFRGSAFQPAQEVLLRSEPDLKISLCRSAPEVPLSRDRFVEEFMAHLGHASRFLTAEFKVPCIEVVAGLPQTLRTLVWYDLVSTGSEFYREQRVGTWDLEWERSAEGKLRVRKWQGIEETRSRAAGPIFVDVTAQVFGGNPSYSQQLLRGTDYWRTVLDGACGIDVYGNNGIAAGDIDNDGFDDLYVCQPAGLPNRLYRNRGDGSFEDVTEAAGVGVLDNTACALFADVDNDGYQDLVVVRAAGPLLFRNDGRGRFRLQPNAFRFAQAPQGAFTGAAFGDYDRDGWLDIYFCLYSYYEGLDPYRFPVPYYDAQNGPPNFLLRNGRDGTFSDVTATAGLNQNNNRYSFDCAWCDYNGDGWPDLYVVNDFGRKNLYRNNGDGTFSDVAEEAGVLDIGPGMSSCWFDYDNDGRCDVYVCDMWEPAGRRVSMAEGFMVSAPESVRVLYRRHAKGNSLFRNQGDSHFEDQSAVAGVENAGWSWSCSAWDFDHDGYSDLYIANGMISGPNRQDYESFFWRQAVSQSPATATPSRAYEQGWNAINDRIRSDGTWNGYQRNVFYVNNRNGTFAHAAGALGLDFLDDSRAFSLADFDHDGRLEVFLKNRTGPQLRMLRNVMQGAGDAIVFRLRGRTSNRDAVGAEIVLETAHSRQTRYVQAGSGFVSQHTKEVFFGLGQAATPPRAQIHWPSGSVQKFDNLPVNHRVEIEEGVDQFRAIPFRAPVEPREIHPPQQVVPLPSVSETWLLEPLSAPEFTLLDLAGHGHTLSSYKGRRLLLNFWATWSSPCEGELRLLEEHHARWAAQGLEVLAISVNGPQEAETIRAFARARRLTVAILMASEDVAGIYNVLYRYLFDRRRDLGIPTSFLVDEQGSIVKIYQGPIKPQNVLKDSGEIPRAAEQRLAKSLPFSGTYYGGEFHRNFFTQGVAFLQRGYLDEAQTSFKLVIHDHPDYPEAHYNLGTLYLQKHLLGDAREHLRRAIQLRPDYISALNNLGLVAAEEGRAEEAVRYFQEASRRNPNYTVALQNLSTLYRQQGRLTEAQRVLEQAIQADPDDAESNYGLGIVLAQQGYADRARTYLQKALKLRPEYPEALNNLGVLYLRAGNSSEALATFKECIRVSPGFDQPYLNLARLFAARGEQEKARAVLQQLLDRHPDHHAAREALDQLRPF